MATSHANNAPRDKKRTKREGRQKPFFFCEKSKNGFICVSYMQFSTRKKRKIIWISSI